MFIKQNDECKTQNQIDYYFLTSNEIGNFLNDCNPERSNSFHLMIDWVINEGKDIDILELKTSSLCSELQLEESLEYIQFLMTLSCAKALAKDPTLKVWDNIKHLQYNSWYIENWLSDIMIFIAEDDCSAKKAYIKISTEVIRELNNYKLKSLSKRENDERELFQTMYSDNPITLEDIWKESSNWSEHNYSSEASIFRALEKIDQAIFISTVIQINNYFLIVSMFFWVGLFKNQSLLEKLINKSPLAFHSDTKWTLSPLLPLLLNSARSQIFQISNNIEYNNPSVISIDTAKENIKKSVKELVLILSKREDAMPLFARWSAWLMRNILLQGFKETTNVKSSAFVDSEIIEEIGSKINQSPNLTVIYKLSTDVFSWENWCYRCVLSSHANNSFISIPDWNDFIEEFNIGIDGWDKTEGKSLRKNSDFIIGLINDLPSDVAHSLAYPIVMSEHPIDIWLKLFEISFPLREIVEFGISSISSSDKYQDRSEAGKLQLFVFCLGLAILDQSVGKRKEEDITQKQDLVFLHEKLLSVAREMSEVDNTLNRDLWKQAIRHLVIRRVIWEEHIVENGYATFTHDSRPTFQDCLLLIKNNEFDLIEVIQSIFLNIPEQHRNIIWNEVKNTPIDFHKAITIVKKLNAANGNKYPINLHQINDLERSYKLSS